MKISVFCFVFSLFYSIKSTNGTSSRIKLENNGYSGILISIDSDVPEDPSILTLLQKHISDASKALYIATKKRAYFKDVSILLPDTWSDMSKYTDASWEWHYRTDVAISKGLNSTEVESFGGCGIKGKRMVLPSRLIFNQQEWRDRFGNIAKTIVHEWAKFRWGVFEEYSTKAKNQFYFSTTTNNIESTRCTAGLQGAIYKKQNQTKIPCPGVNSTTGRYDNDCQFFPYVTKDKNGEHSSIMDRYYVSEIDEFCDDTNHNFEAPNKHNMLCESKSTWHIISASEDFVNGVNPVRNIADGDLVPIFNIVKAKSRKIVLVLDTSGSLLFFQRGRRMVQIVHEYLEEWVKNGYEVGLIEFNIKVRVLQPLTKINSKDDRQLFIDKLKAITFRSYTNIGGGLTEAIVMLEENKADATGGHVILFSDGSEDEKAIIPDPNWSITPLNETIPNLIDAGVVVDTVLLTESADDKMLNVSHSTGGSLYFDSYDDSSSAMIDAFLDIGSRDRAKDDIPVSVVSYSLIIPDLSSHDGEFYLDSSINRDMVCLFTYTRDTPIVVVLISPDGRIYANTSQSFTEHVNADFFKVKIKVNDTVMTGLWKFFIYNPATTDSTVLLPPKQRVAILVTSKSSLGSSPITMTADLSALSARWPDLIKIYAKLRKGNSAVVFANVTAVVDRPFGGKVDIKLQDDGLGDDVTGGDGIYSGTFYALTGSGRHSAVIKAVGYPENTRVKSYYNSFYEDPEDPRVNENYVVNTPITDIFERVVTAGAFEYSHPNIPPKSRIKEADKPEKYLRPSRIIDLEVVKSSVLHGAVTLMWTAPWGRMNSGMVTSYDLRMANTTLSLLTSPDIVPVFNATNIFYGNLSNPRMSGSTEICSLYVSTTRDANETFAFVIRGINPAGYSGKWSNVASVGLGYVPDVDVTNNLEEIGNLTYPPIDISAGGTPANGNKGVVIGVSIGGSLLLIVLIVIVVFLIRNIVKSKQKVDPV